MTDARYGSYLPPDAVQTVAVIGTGSVGASWIALYLARGLSVVATDPAPGAEALARDFVTKAWGALVDLGFASAPEPPLDKLRFVATASEAAAGADFAQENAPEVPDLKGRVLAEIDAALPAGRIIGSSTGGIMPSLLQKHCAHPERFVVLHPFNPAHLIPLVEVIGGEQTDPQAVEWARDFARSLGKHPIVLKKEAVGHLTNRLQFALVREAVHCLAEGIASAEDIDAAVRCGLGPRWALMGGLMTLHLAGGPGGMAGILKHAGPAIEGWWRALGQPSLDGATCDTLIEASKEIARGHEVADWVAWRDEKLVALLRTVNAPPIL